MPKIKLKPGDAVRYEDIQNGDQASAIADAFIKAGAEPGAGYPYLENPEEYQVLFWDGNDNHTNRLGSLLGFAIAAGSHGVKRFLTPEQVLAED